jgi:methylmalonyl-CoA mutase
MDDFSLAGDFPPASEAEWLALAEKAIGGAPFSSLRTRLHEGIETGPLYTKRAARAPLSGNRGWHVIQPLTGVAEQFNDDIGNGAGAISIDLSGPALNSAGELKFILASGLPYYLAPGSPAADAAFVLAAAAKAELLGSAGLDPLSAMALSGEAPAVGAHLLGDAVDAAFYLREQFPRFVPFLASGYVWDGAGGSAVEELAFTLAAGVTYWRALSEAGMPLPDAARCIAYALSASSDLFLTIAKFRAMRLLWARALDAAGERSANDVLLLAKMSGRIVSAYGPHVNILRGTAAAFGAAIGGANGIELLPFDMAQHSTPFSRRLARNTSLILQEESYLSAVADAAAGSAYVEALTDELAKSAWTLFREIETIGGLGPAIENGFVQGRLLLKQRMRAEAITRRGSKITGVSDFPHLAESPALQEQGAIKLSKAVRHAFAGTLPELPPAAKGARFAAIVAAARAGTPFDALRVASRRVCRIVGPPLIQGRDAEPFEALRRHSDAAREKIGSRPPVFLALLGKPAGYRTRAGWLKNFFAAGGIETIEPAEPFTAVELLAAAFRQSPAPAACLCASDQSYAAVPGAAQALKKAGAVAIYLAGPPSVLESLDTQDAAAIDRIINEGCNAVVLLEELHARLHVEELSAASEEEAAGSGFGIHVHGPDCGHG